MTADIKTLLILLIMKVLRFTCNLLKFSLTYLKTNLSKSFKT